MKRFAFLFWACAGLLPLTTYAELTEFQAIEQGMAQPEVQALLEAQLEQARGEKQSAGRWYNPEIEYSQEQIDLPSGNSEETLWWVKQRLNLAGVKGIERDAAAMTLEAAEARSSLERRQWRTRIRTRFYDTLAAQTGAEVLTGHRNRLQQVATMIEQRVAAGDASEYDRLRIAQELARAQSLAAQAQARQEAERQKLFGLIGGEPHALTGKLLPPQSGRSTQTLGQHPQLLMLMSLKRSAELGTKAARRSAWPEVSLGLGRKSVDESGFSAEGNAVALSLEIPLFDRSRGEAQRSRGLAREYAADYALTHKRLRARQKALQTTLAARRESALAFRQATAGGERSLSALAEASYQAGEVTIMELVDAYRAELDTRQQYIDSARSARATFIELQQLEGQ